MRTKWLDSRVQSEVVRRTVLDRHARKRLCITENGSHSDPEFSGIPPAGSLPCGQLRTYSAIENGPEGAAFDYLLINKAFFRLANPIKPIRPELNNQTAGGTGMGDIGAPASEVIVRS